MTGIRSDALRFKVRVYCTQFASCRWAGYRNSDNLQKPCPKCGKQVAA